MILKGEHLFITGGAAGIGEALVIGGAKEGAKVSFVDIDDAKGNALVDKLTHEGHQVQFTHADAGRNSYADAVEYAEQEWNDFFALDLKSSWYLAKLCLPEMRKAKYGSIVNISSIHGRMSRPNFFPYSAAKGGIIGLSRNLALDEGKYGIRVNSVSPGTTATPLLKSYMEKFPDEKAHALAVAPNARFGSPEEIANVILFALSKDASFITGADLMVDGALHARYA
jgi:NAD(P)-dependent dehydrogenase (short-subunit alcohol dehydrogenase family)